MRLDTPHTELRLKATFHYIDRWEGASAYARVDSQFVWAESYALPPAAEKRETVIKTPPPFVLIIIGLP